MEITPVRRVNTVEQVYQQMQNMLIDGTWKPGQKLPSEGELTERFGVSRITIRAALEKLKALGLIETHSGSGSFVRQLSMDDTLRDLVPVMVIGDLDDLQIFQYREMIDSESARIAAVNPRPEDVAMLRSLLRRMQKDAADNDSAAFSKDDLDFHLQVAKMTHNPLFVRTNKILMNVLQASMSHVIDKMKYEPGLDYHARILLAIEAGNSERASALMREHIRHNYEYFQ